jgi:hypothetical protein
MGYSRVCNYVFLFTTGYEGVWRDPGHSCVSVYQNLKEGGAKVFSLSFRCICVFLTRINYFGCKYSMYRTLAGQDRDASFAIRWSEVICLINWLHCMGGLTRIGVRLVAWVWFVAHCAAVQAHLPVQNESRVKIGMLLCRSGCVG